MKKTNKKLIIKILLALIGLFAGGIIYRGCVNINNDSNVTNGNNNTIDNSNLNVSNAIKINSDNTNTKINSDNINSNNTGN
jgi:hypothetical protein